MLVHHYILGWQNKDEINTLLQLLYKKLHVWLIESGYAHRTTALPVTSH